MRGREEGEEKGREERVDGEEKKESGVGDWKGLVNDGKEEEEGEEEEEMSGRLTDGGSEVFQ